MGSYNHACSPENSDCGKEPARSNLTKNDSRRWLEENIRDEEYEGNNSVSVSNKLELDGHSATR